MHMTEEKAFEILQGLIAKADTKTEEISRVWQEIIAAHEAMFAPVVVETKKRRQRRFSGTLSPNLGWPKGVSRVEYKTWKDSLPADYAGMTNPQEYKRQRDGINESAAVEVAADVNEVVTDSDENKTEVIAESVKFKSLPDSGNSKKPARKTKAELAKAVDDSVNAV